eukprot:767689-Hanusia_phi.AAC.3
MDQKESQKRYQTFDVPCHKMLQQAWRFLVKFPASTGFARKWTYTRSFMNAERPEFLRRPTGQNIEEGLSWRDTQM